MGRGTHEESMITVSRINGSFFVLHHHAILLNRWHEVGRVPGVSPQFFELP